jgi:hypothetical protein
MKDSVFVLLFCFVRMKVVFFLDCRKDLGVIYNDIEAPFQALQIIFEMRSEMSVQKRAVKKMHFFKLQNVAFFSFFFILTPPTSLVHHNFRFFFWFKLSDLNCSEIAILSSTNHLVTLQATE